MVLIAIRIACVAAVERVRGLGGKGKGRGIGFSPSRFSPLRSSAYSFAVLYSPLWLMFVSLYILNFPRNRHADLGGLKTANAVQSLTSISISFMDNV